MSDSVNMRDQLQPLDDIDANAGTDPQLAREGKLMQREAVMNALRLFHRSSLNTGLFSAGQIGQAGSKRRRLEEQLSGMADQIKILQYKLAQLPSEEAVKNQKKILNRLKALSLTIYNFVFSLGEHRGKPTPSQAEILAFIQNEQEPRRQVNVQNEQEPKRRRMRRQVIDDEGDDEDDQSRRVVRIEVVNEDDDMNDQQMVRAEAA